MVKRAVWTIAVLFLLAVAMEAALRESDPVANLAPIALASSQPRTFTGIIMQSGRRLLLIQEDPRKAYEIDNQLAATTFKGQKVTVTGSLDSTNHLIHVQAIGPFLRERVHPMPEHETLHAAVPS
jgi:precorrin-6B methylase 1